MSIIETKKRINSDKFNRLRHGAYDGRRYAFCCTFPDLAVGGRYPPRCPVEPGLSSRRFPNGQRPFHHRPAIVSVRFNHSQINPRRQPGHIRTPPESILSFIGRPFGRCVEGARAGATSTRRFPKYALFFGKVNAGPPRSPPTPRSTAHPSAHPPAFRFPKNPLLTAGGKQNIIPGHAGFSSTFREILTITNEGGFLGVLFTDMNSSFVNLSVGFCWWPWCFTTAAPVVAVPKKP